MLLATIRYRFARRERRLGHGSKPIGSEFRQLVEVLQQQIPADLFLMESPFGPGHHHVATDKVRRNLVALVERDLGNVGQWKLPEQGCVYGGHEVLVACPPNVRNGSKAVIGFTPDCPHTLTIATPQPWS